MASSDNEWTIHFFPNLEIFAHALCLYWLKEIHIAEIHRNQPYLPDMIAHEKKHYAFITKALNTECRIKRGLILLHNNLWDFFDIMRFTIKHRRHFPFAFIRLVLILGVSVYVLCSAFVLWFLG